MIINKTYKTGNMLHSTADVLINPVNVVGVMGKGLALEFRKQYPENYKLYRERCGVKLFRIGEVMVTQEKGKYIVNFPTKKHWKDPSQYEYIEKSLDALIKIMPGYIKARLTIAFPHVGCGLGGLDWAIVEPMIIDKYSKAKYDVNLEFWTNN
jgi:O-acetyl-ADP-ribose deacetylase (regulator of RNase III)